MTTIMLILVAAALGLGLSWLLHLPAIPLLVIAGVGLHVAGAVDDATLLQDVLMLGLAFLVFVLGTELSPRRVGAQARAAVGVGLAQFLVLGLVGLVCMRGLGFGWMTALYTGLALASSSTLVVLNLLRQRQQFFEPFGRLVVGVLLLQDILVIIAIAVLGRLDEGLAGVAWSVAGLGGLLAAAGVCIRWVGPAVLTRLEDDDETLLIVVLAVLFLFVGAAHVMGLPVVAGAFLGGVALSGFPTHGIVRGQLSSLADFFLALFFVALGGVLTLPDSEQFALLVLFVLVVLFVTPPLVALMARRVGLTARSSIESGLLLAQCSEFSIIIALLGLDRGHLDSGLVSVIALTTVVTMILTPWTATDAATWRIMRAGWRRRLPAPDTARRGHVLMLGSGTQGMRLLNALLAHGHEVVVVDDDAAVVAELQRRDVAAYRGDGADMDVLTKLGAADARAIISNMRRVRDNLRMLAYVRQTNRDVPVLVRVFAPAEAARIREHGGTAIVDSEAAADAFLNWFDRQQG
ncbi:MAG: cation:proton antiporter [Phycisphaeraceae bacterium]